MPFRYFDWECTRCEYTHADLVWVDTGKSPPSKAKLHCPVCEVETQHQKRMSAPARYMYDKPYAPIVSGGKYDTTGLRKLPELPALPYEKEFDKARDMYHSKEYQERLGHRHAMAQENAAKRKRAAALKRGESLDMRTNPLPGDPPLDRVAKVKAKRKKISA